MKAGRTAYMRKAVKPTHVSNTQRAVKPDPALTRATQSANRIQPFNMG
jgi:hypothetical protein